MKTNFEFDNGFPHASGISDELYIHYHDLINSFLTKIEKDIQLAGPNEIIEILSVLFNLKDFLSTENWINYTYRVLGNMRTQIYSGKYSVLSAFGGMTNILFSVDEFSTKNLGLKNFCRKLGDVQSQQISEILKLYSSPEQLIYNHFELMTGISGPLRYWLDVEDERAFELSTKMTKFLLRNSMYKMINGYKVPGWHYYPSAYEARYMNVPALNGCINYSVSHGMGGPLLTLSYAYWKGIRIEGLLEAIRSLIHEYKDSFYRVNNVVYWPGRITFEQYINKENLPHISNRMSWCYGSIGILRILYLSALYIEDHVLKEWAMRELINIAEVETEDYQIDSPIVCHGYAGVAAIMNEMYRDTQNLTFREKTYSLLDIITNNLLDSETSKNLKRYNYLEGYSGVLQTVMSILCNKPSSSMKRMLIT